MKIFSRTAIIETIKEAGRIALFAAISALVAWAGQQLAGMDQNSTFVIVGTIVLRLVDRFVHKNPDIQAQGVAPF